MTLRKKPVRKKSAAEIKRQNLPPPPTDPMMSGSEFEEQVMRPPRAAADYKRTIHDVRRLADMVALGATHQQMAQRLGLAERDLAKIYDKELEALGSRPNGLRHVPSDLIRERVREGIGIGLKPKQVCKILGFSEAVLKEHYLHEVETGQAQTTWRVGANLVRQAEGDGKASVIAAIYYMKTRAQGWQETGKLEVSGPDGEPIRTEGRVIVMLPPNGRDTKPLTIEHDG